MASSVTLTSDLMDVMVTSVAGGAGGHDVSSSSSNWSRQAYVEQMRGPQRHDYVIAMTLVYGAIFVTGIVGNVCTCVVIARNRYMQTATNCYLFNLALADLLMLVLGLPTEVYGYWSAYPWPFGRAFCLVRALAAETSTYASILTITAFTVERYLAICHPMKAKATSGPERAIKIVVITWFIAIVCAVPMVTQFGIGYIDGPDGQPMAETAICDVISERKLPHSFEVSTILFFLVPMTAITVLYALIGVAILRSAHLSRAGSDMSDQVAGLGAGPSPEGHTAQGQGHGQQWLPYQQQRRGGVLKMLVTVVVAFFLCWAPFHAQRLLINHRSRDAADQLEVQLYTALYYSSGILYYVSTIINPILYNIMSLKFRQAFLHTIFHPCTLPSPHPQPRPHGVRPSHLHIYRFNSKPVPGSAEHKASPSVVMDTGDVALRHSKCDVRATATVTSASRDQREKLVLSRDAIATAPLPISPPAATARVYTATTANNNYYQSVVSESSASNRPKHRTSISGYAPASGNSRASRPYAYAAISDRCSCCDFHEQTSSGSSGFALHTTADDGEDNDIPPYKKYIPRQARDDVWQRRPDTVAARRGRSAAAADDTDEKLASARRSRDAGRASLPVSMVTHTHSLHSFS